ncbi:MAG: homoserine dehydrogenase [Actinomycetota bacterium]
MKIGLLGCGIVGGALVELLEQRREDIRRTTGLELELARVAVRSTSKTRSGLLDTSLLTTDAEAVVNDPDIDLVVEVIGGIEPARSLIQSALKAGKAVVTANKELLANVGPELYATADANGVDLLFEAAAAGAIPIVRPLRESLLGEEITRIMGILNGTTNYILTKMTEEGADYAEALAEAQRLGYAERDPTADVEGYDAGAKAAIMASIAFGQNVVAGDVYHEGIAEVSAVDIAFADRLNYEIKLLGIAEVFDGDKGGREIGVRVHPAMVPRSHPLASVRDSFNAVFVEGVSAGELMFYGRGAGGAPTASAVLGDVIDAAANRSRGTHRPVPTGPRATIRPIDDLESAYYVNAEVADAPGVLAAVAGVFGAHDVSIRSMEQEQEQPDASEGPAARIAFITHEAKERNLQATLQELHKLDVVTDIRSVLRVVGE